MIRSLMRNLFSCQYGIICFNHLVDTPVACPIDRKIMSIAKKPDNDPDKKIKIMDWTELGLKDKKQYCYMLKALNNWSGKESIAEKELSYWNNATNL